MAHPLEADAGKLVRLCARIVPRVDDAQILPAIMRRMCCLGATRGVDVDLDEVVVMVQAAWDAPSAHEAEARDMMERRRKPANIDPSIVCRSCRQRSCYRFQRQTRSGDEGATPMVYCDTCQRITKE
jgi:DNA-directed RNA polymerase subunit M/transcription elongation factor TFIIS